MIVELMINMSLACSCQPILDEHVTEFPLVV